MHVYVYGVVVVTIFCLEIDIERAGSDPDRGRCLIVIDSQCNTIQFKEGLISRDEALLRINAKAMDFFLHPYVSYTNKINRSISQSTHVSMMTPRPTCINYRTIDPAAPKTVVAKGLPASPGVGTGGLVFSSDEAEAMAKAGFCLAPPAFCRRIVLFLSSIYLLSSHTTLRYPPHIGQAGKAVVLVRKETTAEDIHGMKSAKGVLTEQV